MSSLANAYETCQKRREETAKKAKDALKVAGYTDAISSGDMTVEEALQKALQEERDEKEKLAAQADARIDGCCSDCGSQRPRQRTLSAR